MGYTNSSLYTGSIEYHNLTETPTWWVIDISGITIQGNSITPPTGSSAEAMIDSGTTLIYGPASTVEEVYSNIPNAQMIESGDWAGYYQYPCSTSVNLTLSFGGAFWPISNADFQAVQGSGSDANQCIGALAPTEQSAGFPAWIVGDTFLKNVYTVFSYSPAAVGFAALSETAIAENGVNGTPPGDVGSQGGEQHSSGAVAGRLGDPLGVGAWAALLVGLVGCMMS